MIKQEAAKKEIDPHFLFNSLTTLSHLVQQDGKVAHRFIQHLSACYKYFFLNRTKDLVLLSDELSFLESYFYLLSIRFGAALHTEIIHTNTSSPKQVVPFKVYAGIDAIMKHNLFTEDKPLLITIEVKKDAIHVQFRMASSGVSLTAAEGRDHRNQLSRPKSIKGFSLHEKEGRAILSVPLINQIPVHYDKSNHN